MAIIISRQKQVEEKINKICTAGPEQLHVISDFDRTMTKSMVNGQKVMSSYARIRDGNYLSENFSKESSALFAKYHPIEVDPNIPLDIKKQKMKEWWEANWNLMLRCGMRREVVEAVAKDPSLQLRNGAKEFIESLGEHKIPLLIFSSGLGNIIAQFLENKELFLSHVHLVSNMFTTNEQGKCTGFTQPMITVFSKNEHSVTDPQYLKKIQERKNVILLGDSLGDIGMSEGIEHDTILRIGFFDKEEINGLRKQYIDAFDILLTEHADFSYVNELLERIRKKNSS